MITPHQLDLWSSNMAELYNSLEGEIIRLLIKHLKDGSRDITDWQAKKLYELRLFNNEVVSLLSKVTDVSEKEIKRMFKDAGEGIIKDIDKSMTAPSKPLPSNLDMIMQAYYEQAWGDIENYVNQTLITTNFGIGTAQIAYQNVLNQTAAMFNTGIYTFEESLERAITDLAQKGIRTTLTDRGNNTWSLEGYVRTVLKSTLGNTYNELRTQRMSEYGVYTVVVTSHVGARKQCSAIQGNVVDLRMPSEIPKDSEYKSIYDPSWGADYGTAGGHRGVNCRHSHIPFIPGVNTNNQPHYDADLNAEVAQARDTQRRIEREIVKYKKKLMVAEELGSDKADYWRMMVRRRQAAIREHIDKNNKYLSRNYKREKVYTPLSTLMKEFKEKGHASYLSKSELRSANEQYQRYKSLLGSERLPRSIDGFIDLKYNKVEEWDKIQDNYYVKSKLKDGQFGSTINPEKQAPHMQATKIEGKSYFYDSVDVQKIFDEYAGTGVIERDNNGKRRNTEKMRITDNIGIAVSLNGVRQANFIKIHHSKNRTHIVPIWKDE
ncbi:phage minor capsid protein [Cytobacillus kochii]|uniref:phage minor capsid protein n=1 Tax=Cytobacillus kochii TaxID=859143 RepID=UPI002780C629|nr:phage minor capsid protein [Cytobacillus kochii]MDQ0186330.1 hypothetical protein [Cytobacillus kochii]